MHFSNTFRKYTVIQTKCTLEITKKEYSSSCWVVTKSQTGEKHVMRYQQTNVMKNADDKVDVKSRTVTQLPLRCLFLYCQGRCSFTTIYFKRIVNLAIAYLRQPFISVALSGKCLKKVALLKYSNIMYRRNK